MVVAVIVIWGIILFRVISLKNTPNRTAPNPHTQNAIVHEYTKDSFSINNSYADPFLTKTSVFVNKEKITHKVVGKTELKKQEPKPVINWPTIYYKGLITSKEKKIGLLDLDKRNYIISLKDTVNDIIVQYIDNDSIVLKYYDTFKTIKKQ